MEKKIHKKGFAFILCISLVCNMLIPVRGEAAAPIVPTDVTYTVDQDKQQVTFCFTGSETVKTYSLKCSDTKEGTYSTVAYVNNSYGFEGKQISLTDTISLRGNGYWYRIQAWTTTGYTSSEVYTEPVYIELLPKTPVLNADDCAGYICCIKLTWENSDSLVKSFSVYRSTSKTGTYQRVGKTSQNFYYDTEVTPNTTYYYCLTANGKSGLESKKTAAVKLITKKTTKYHTSKKTIPNFASYSGKKGSSTTKTSQGIKVRKIVYKNITSGMYQGYRSLLGEKKYQLADVVYGTVNTAFDYTGKAKIVRGVSAVSDLGSYASAADLYLHYDSDNRTLTIYQSPSFKLAKVSKSKRYKKSKDETAAEKYNSKTMKWCVQCGHTGKTKCMNCNGTGKRKAYVYNSTTKVYDYVYVTCQYCSNGKVSCSACNGRGWNWK